MGGGRANRITCNWTTQRIGCCATCYEGNLLALAPALDRLALLWPDGKLTLPRVEQAVNDAAHFTPFHWVDALLMAKSKRALHICSTTP